jgi:hypothetical protein
MQVNLYGAGFALPYIFAFREARDERIALLLLPNIFADMRPQNVSYTRVLVLEDDTPLPAHDWVTDLLRGE